PEELRRRTGSRGVGDLLVADGDPAAPVFLSQEGVANELLECLILETLAIVQRDALAAFLCRLLFKLLGQIEPARCEYVFAVDRSDSGRVRHRRAAEEPRCLHQQEAADEENDYQYPDVLCGRPHRL